MTGDIPGRMSGFGDRSVPIGGPRRKAGSAATRTAFVPRAELGLRECCKAIGRREIPVEAGIVERERTGPLVREGRGIERILATVVRKSRQRAKA